MVWPGEMITERVKYFNHTFLVVVVHRTVCKWSEKEWNAGGKIRPLGGH